MALRLTWKKPHRLLLKKMLVLAMSPTQNDFRPRA